jgi:hypothetical protein
MVLSADLLVVRKAVSISSGPLYGRHVNDLVIAVRLCVGDTIGVTRPACRQLDGGAGRVDFATVSLSFVRPDGYDGQNETC